MKTWFLLKQNVVTGPYTNSEVSERISKYEGDKSLRIWSRQISSWKDTNWWKANIDNLENAIHLDKSSEKSTWSFYIDDEEYGTFTKTEFIEQMAQVEEFKNLLYKAHPSDEWEEIFTNDRLLEECNISKREFPRAVIDGFIKVIVDQKAVTLGQLKSISEGGCSASGVNAIKTGDSVNILVKSSSLHEEFLLKAEVRYITRDGLAGFQFTDPNPTIKNVIRDYVNLKIAEHALSA